MALADRDYMRDEARGWRWSATVTLMIAIAVAYFLQQFINRDFVDSSLALSSDGLKKGYVWQLLTFQFLHAGLWHLTGNLLGIWFLGHYIEFRLGKASLLKIYFASGIAGGLLQAVLGLIFAERFGSPVLGASAGVVGLLAAFAMFEPDAKVLLWFILPVKAKHFLWFSLGLALFFVVVPSQTGIAHTAHLGGLLTGIAMIHWRLYEQTRGFDWPHARSQKRKPQLVKTVSHSGGFWRQSIEARGSEDVTSEEFISREVDPILDKISAHGIQSLTERERTILEAARKKMSRS